MPEPYNKNIEGWEEMNQDKREKALRSAMIADGVLVPDAKEAKPEPKENIKVVATGA